MRHCHEALQLLVSLHQRMRMLEGMYAARFPEVEAMYTRQFELLLDVEPQVSKGEANGNS